MIIRPGYRKDSFRTAGCGGYLIMDAVVAMAILSVAMTSLLYFFQREVLLVRRLHHEEIALQIADSEMDLLRSIPFDEIRNREDEEVSLRQKSAELLRSPHCFATVEDEGALGADLKRVTITIGWQAFRGVPREITLESLIGRARADALNSRER